jgi:hypothetical protein
MIHHDPNRRANMRATALTSAVAGVILLCCSGCAHQESPTPAEQAAMRAEDSARRAEAAASRVEAAAQRAEAAARKTEQAAQYSYRK